MEKGYLLLVLHAHLPFVRHPEYNDFLEEDWLYEAISETYIPLLNMFDRLAYEGVDWRLTMSMTPPLISMLQDQLLQERYIRHIDLLIELAEKEITRTQYYPELNKLAYMYLNKFINCREVFVDRYKRDIVSGFKKHLESGKLDIITCGATHGFFPNMESTKQSVEAQVAVATQHYHDTFGRGPKGIWLPECGYCPNDDEILQKNGIRYFYSDTHAILHGTPRPKYGVFAPVYCPSGTACFSRDVESSKQVWSSKEGYPGDHYYRDFYRDIGFDLDFDYIKPYIHPDGIRINTGIKYHRITGDSDYKEVYIPEIAEQRASAHASNFMFNREKQVEHLFDRLQRKPVIVAPYDAELYGHWWYEGPMWLEFLIKKIHHEQNTIRLTHAADYLRENPKNQVVTPSFSSWGYKGYSEHWLDGSNDWVYKHLHKASVRMQELAETYKDAYGITERALKQAARELLLAESSDWAFIMKTNTMVEYAVKRTKDHILNFTRLYWDIKNNTINQQWLSEVESRNNIFPNVDFRVYAS